MPEIVETVTYIFAILFTIIALVYCVIKYATNDKIISDIFVFAVVGVIWSILSLYKILQEYLVFGQEVDENVLLVLLVGIFIITLVVKYGSMKKTIVDILANVQHRDKNNIDNDLD